MSDAVQQERDESGRHAWPEHEQGNLSFLTGCEEDSDKLSAIFFLEIGAS